ncbi:MAG: GWxTD domain-containing protein [Bacteroidia bacterium]|nr:GWxTD domain-containing protein [Bacteroidia bacterium]
MKGKLYIIACGLLGLISGTLTAQTREIKLYTDLCRFQDPRNGDPYVQIYVAIPGSSVNFRREADSLYDACVNVTLRLYRLLGQDTTQVDGDVYNLHLPAEKRLRDTLGDSPSLVGLYNMHQLRLEPGRYLLSAMAMDSNAVFQSRSLAYNEFEVARIEPGQFAFSDIKWVSGEIESADKSDRRVSGRDDLLPLVTNSSFINKDSMIFYQELYNSDKILNERFLIRCVVYQGENRLWTTETRGQAREPRQVNAYKEKIFIGNLSSNTYYLQVEVVNGKNQPIQTYRQRFYVYNSRRDPGFDQQLLAENPEAAIFNEYTEEQLNYYLKTLTPRSTEQEQNFIKVLTTYQQKKNFLYSFFERRKDRPEQEILALWKGHLAALEYVNQQFKSSFRPGWQTDRGRIFLRYGIPSDVERFPAEPNLIPYEIWRYNRLGSQTNVIFVFYDADLATNDYPLLHSSKYGELNNPMWRSQLSINNQGRTPGGVDYERELDRTDRFNTKLDPND